MKITGKVKLKDNITSVDISNVIDTIVQFVFYMDDNGNAVYTPYFMNDGLKVGILLSLVEGLEFDGTENVSEIIQNDKIISKIVEDYINEGTEIPFIMDNSYDIIDFRKNEYLHKDDDLKKALQTALAKETLLNEALLQVAQKQGNVLDQQIKANAKQEEIISQLSDDELVSLQKKIANGDFEMKDVAGAIVDRYFEETKRDEQYKDIIDEKNKTIVELKDHLKKEGK